MKSQSHHTPMPCSVVRRYQAFDYPSTRKVQGDTLAPELIKEALRLLCAEYRQDVQKAYEALDLIASQSAASLLDVKAAGKKPGLVVYSGVKTARGRSAVSDEHD